MAPLIALFSPNQNKRAQKLLLRVLLDLLLPASIGFFAR